MQPLTWAALSGVHMLTPSISQTGCCHGGPCSILRGKALTGNPLGRRVVMAERQGFRPVGDWAQSHNFMEYRLIVLIKHWVTCSWFFIKRYVHKQNRIVVGFRKEAARNSSFSKRCLMPLKPFLSQPYYLRIRIVLDINAFYVCLTGVKLFCLSK